MVGVKEWGWWDQGVAVHGVKGGGDGGQGLGRSRGGRVKRVG